MVTNTPTGVEDEIEGLIEARDKSEAGIARALADKEAESARSAREERDKLAARLADAEARDATVAPFLDEKDRAQLWSRLSFVAVVVVMLPVIAVGVEQLRSDDTGVSLSTGDGLARAAVIGLLVRNMSPEANEYV